jgi:hypothetical protein
MVECLCFSFLFNTPSSPSRPFTFCSSPLPHLLHLLPHYFPFVARSEERFVASSAASARCAESRERSWDSRDLKWSGLSPTLLLLLSTRPATSIGWRYKETERKVLFGGGLAALAILIPNSRGRHSRRSKARGERRKKKRCSKRCCTQSPGTSQSLGKRRIARMCKRMCLWNDCIVRM